MNRTIRSSSIEIADQMISMLVILVLLGVVISCQPGSLPKPDLTSTSLLVMGPHKLQAGDRLWLMPSVHMVRLQSQDAISDWLQISVAWKPELNFRSDQEALDTVWPLIRKFYTSGLYEEIIREFKADPPLQMSGIWVMLLHKQNLFLTTNYRVDMSLREIQERIDQENQTSNRK